MATKKTAKKPAKKASKTLSKSHLAALEAGRREAAAVKAYLAHINSKQPGTRQTSAATLKKRIDAATAKRDMATNPLEQLKLTQEILSLQTRYDKQMQAEDTKDIEAAFISVAASYSSRNGISYQAWREIGVEASTLKQAGISRAHS